jgi:hypothetical protein
MESSLRMPEFKRFSAFWYSRIRYVREQFLITNSAQRYLTLFLHLLSTP